MKKKTIIDLFNECVTLYAENPFLWERNIVFRSTSYKETQILVHRLSGGLLNLGLKKGERIALLSEGCNSWIIGELSILHAGGVNVPLSIKLNESNDLIFRLNHSEARFVMVSSTQLPKIRIIKDSLKTVEKVIVFGAKSEDLQENEMTLDELYVGGEKWNAANPGKMEKISEAVDNDDYANISYTSGTTADPKGILLTHRNYTANVEQALSLMDIPETYRTLLILPLDHCFAHVAGFYSFMASGASIATVPVGKTPIESLKNIPLSIKEIQPNLLLSVPALAKTFKGNIEKGVREKGPMVEKLFRMGLKVAIAYNKEGYNKGTKGTFVLKPLVRFFDKVIFSQLRGAMGGKLDFFVGGGALLDIDMQKFWYAIGIPMFQGYGLSEATPVISANGLKKHKLGSSGFLVKNLEMTIRDEKGNILPVGQKGEMVIKGENVMAGYWKNPESTAGTIKDGWLYTGDLGAMDKDGFLYVYGRFKSLLIASDGEKYSPEGIEESMVTLSPYIDQIMLYNNQSPYTVALIVPAKDALKRNISNYDTPEGKKTAIELIQKSVNAFRKDGAYEGMFPERWIPAAFAILSEGFTEQNQMMNSTMKMVRGKIEKHYAKRLDQLMTAEGKNPFNEKNIDALN
ncbi:MAG: AMP-binding protein [Bacteroidales bacterium]|nr:AMP-binding protein [Bacteroidales bacterium]MDD3906969.1 AMP-binding protein [Bacteroidales bacterium]MDD4712769.1 AMP-binding protein [Bacteroidales bacterium]